MKKEPLTTTGEQRREEDFPWNSTDSNNGNWRGKGFSSGSQTSPLTSLIFSAF